MFKIRFYYDALVKESLDGFYFVHIYVSFGKKTKHLMTIDDDSYNSLMKRASNFVDYMNNSTSLWEKYDTFMSQYLA